MAVRRTGGGGAFPSWIGLLERAAQRIEEEGRSQHKVIRALLQESPPETMDAAAWSRRGLGAQWSEFLRDSFGVPRGDVDPDSLALAQAVWGLGSKLVITTNYDRVLRWGCPDHHDLATWPISAPGGLIEALRGPVASPTVWHLHGSIDQPSQIILSPDGYATLYPEDEGKAEILHQAALEALRHLMMSRHLLFVGFSMEDDYLVGQLRWVSETFGGCAGPHYVLARGCDVQRMQTKLEGLDVDFIEVEGFGDLAPKLREIGAAHAAPPTSAPATVESTRATADSPEVGELFADRYALGELAGDGGFARVFRAQDQRGGLGEVAVKVLRPEWRRDEGRVRRFCQGAEVTRELSHPNIVATLEGPSRHGEHHYYVMPWLAGGNLRRALESGRIAVEAGLKVVAEALEGLAHAHRQGLVHRDVKPENILIDADGRGLLADFDLVRGANAGGTRTMGGMGTIVYAAPELLDEGVTPDPRADVYAAAMSVVYVLLGRRPPLAIARTEPRLLAELPVDRRLREVLTRALDYDRVCRPGDCGELIAALRGVKLGVRTPPALDAATDVGTMATGSSSTKSSARAWAPTGSVRAAAAEVGAPDGVSMHLEPAVYEARASEDPRVELGGVAQEALRDLEGLADAEIGREEDNSIRGEREEGENRGKRWSRRDLRAMWVEGRERRGIVAGVVSVFAVWAWIVLSMVMGSSEPRDLVGGSGVPWSHFGDDMEEPEPDESVSDGPIQIGVYTKPSWVRASGEDAYGRWAEFQVGEVIQRMRWIPAGIFTMGSPGEGPRHQVRLSEGYWMADTECTQALWAEVMEDNPSKFVSPTRPVEQVSWEDVQVFIPKLNARVPGLQAGLPTEAQWERACRWKSAPGPYVDAIEIVGTNNAPALDLIAWYGGNSGIDFELQTGWDSSDWSEKQYPHTLAGTHPVRAKRPNGAGLYDMLGNVREWCADGARTYLEAAGVTVDPVGSSGWGAVRGGDWNDAVGGVSAAYRTGHGYAIRYSDLGFRLARGP